MGKRASVATPKKAKNGTWGFVFDSQYPRPNGSRRQLRRRGFATRAEAARELKRLQAEDKPSEDLTVSQVLDRFVKQKERLGRAPNTINQYRWAAGRANEKWGGWQADTLTGEQLDDAYTEWLASGKKQAKRGQGTVDTGDPLTPRAVEAIHKTIKAAYALELKRRGSSLRWNPADDAICPTVGEQATSWWTPDQVAEFLAYAPTSDRLPTGLVDMLVDSGGRRGEVLHTRWPNLDLDAGTATVTRQFSVNSATNKVEDRPTKRPRSKSVISLHPDTVAALRARRKEQAADRLKAGPAWPGEDDPSHDLVFTYDDGRMIRPDTLTRVIAQLGVDAGLPRLTPHGLRHSFATAALKRRVPVEVVAARLGNTTRVVQETYRHVIPTEDQEAAQLVGDLFRKKRTS